MGYARLGADAFDSCIATDTDSGRIRVAATMHHIHGRHFAPVTSEGQLVE
jgi:hypothetical protein